MAFNLNNLNNVDPASTLNSLIIRQLLLDNFNNTLSNVIYFNIENQTIILSKKNHVLQLASAFTFINIFIKDYLHLYTNTINPFKGIIKFQNEQDYYSLRHLAYDKNVEDCIINLINYEIFDKNFHFAFFSSVINNFNDNNITEEYKIEHFIKIYQALKSKKKYSYYVLIDEI